MCRLHSTASVCHCMSANAAPGLSRVPVPHLPPSHRSLNALVEPSRPSCCSYRLAELRCESLKEVWFKGSVTLSMFSSGNLRVLPCRST